MKTKVLFLAEELRVGGAESYFYSIENNVDRNKYDFYCMAVNGEKLDALSYPELYTEYSFSFFDRYRKAWKLCVEKDIKVIHVNSLRLAFVAALIKRKKQIKVIYTKHNLTVLDKYCKLLYALFLNRNMDIVNVICNTEKAALINMGIKEDKIEVIYNGIQLDKFPYVRNVSIGNPKIGILARLSQEKNHMLFLDIAEQLHEINDSLTFMIGGDGPERERIESEIYKRNMISYVQLCGYVNSFEFLSKVDYSMLVSQREAFPISIIEAMAVGALVIAKDVGGIRELIDNTDGYIVEGDNAGDYVAEVTKALYDQDKENKRTAARRKAETSFTFKQMMEKIENMYSSDLQPGKF